MKVLVSTQETQGERDNDHCFVPDGELLTFGMECDGAAVDDKCGCRRGLVSMGEGGATTTMEVVDRPDLTRAGYIKLWMTKQLRDGWLTSKGKLTDEEKAWAAEDTSEMLRMASTFPTGAILEKRGDTFQARRLPGGWAWGQAFIGEVDAIWAAYNAQQRITLVPGIPKTGKPLGDLLTGVVGYTDIPIKLPTLKMEAGEEVIPLGMLIEICDADTDEVLWRCENYKGER